MKILWITLFLFTGCLSEKTSNKYELTVYQGNNDFKEYTKFRCRKRVTNIDFESCTNLNSKRKVDYLRLPISKMIEINRVEE